MNTKIISLLVFLALSLSSIAAESSILLIAADELSRDWIGAYGSEAKTPAIDKLANNGLKFTTNWQTDIDKKKAEKNFLSGSYKGQGIPFPALLKKAGYKTYYVGSANSGTLLNNANAIKQAGFQYYSLNSGSIQNLKLKSSLAESVVSIMKQKQKSFVFVRFSARSLKSKEDYLSYVKSIDSFVKGIDSLTKASAPVTIIFTSITGTKLHAKMTSKTSKSVTRNPFDKGKKYKKETFVVRDKDLRLPLIVKSPLIPENGLFTRDLIDGSDFAPTIADLAGIQSEEKENSKSFKPAIGGDLDPRIKKNWIYCNAGKEKLIRSWYFVYHTNDRIFGLHFDPEQKMNLLVGKNNDKHYAGERVRLKMIYERDFLGIKPKADKLVKVETLEK